MPFTVGCVPYVNAMPLAFGLESLGIRTIYAIPSQLPGLLEKGQADSILVSSLDILTKPRRVFVAGFAIATRGPAESVRLFSRVPFDEIRSLALDESSMTSNALARLVLAERYGVEPRCEVMAPGLATMLERHDAAVLIGDPGLSADAAGLQELDLGQAWGVLTGLPFVWALWTGREDLPLERAGLLQRSAEMGLANLEAIAMKAAERTGWPLERCRHYLMDVMDYRLTEEHLAGLAAFQRRLLDRGLIHEAVTLKAVAPAEASRAQQAFPSY